MLTDAPARKSPVWTSQNIKETKIVKENYSSSSDFSDKILYHKICRYEKKIID
jgi:hypothetical protein